MGSKYVFKPDSNPGVGTYEIPDPAPAKGGYIQPEPERFVLTKSKSAMGFTLSPKRIDSPPIEDRFRNTYVSKLT